MRVKRWVTAVWTVAALGAACGAASAQSGPANPAPGAIFGPVEGAAVEAWPEGPIPSDFRSIDLPPYTGEPAPGHPMYAPRPPHNPSLFSGGESDLNADSYGSNTVRATAALGDSPESNSMWMGDRECVAEVKLDARRLATVCYSVSGAYAILTDPVTLHRLAVFQLPARDETTTATDDFRPQLVGGGYFYVDHSGDIVMPTALNEIFVLSTGTAAAPALRLAHRYPVPLASGDKLLSILPDWQGRIWFVSRQGRVGTVDLARGKVQSRDLHETFDNALSADPQGGVFGVTTAALYRFSAGPNGVPQLDWREPYPNDGVRKPPAATAGSGTSPTLLDTKAGHFVAIADNADPIDVRIYRRDAGVPGDQRLVCSVPVFPTGHSATATSMIGAGRTVIVTNQSGYHGPGQTADGAEDIFFQRLTSPGMARIDLSGDATGCVKRWNSSVRIASGVPKLALGSGLIYGVERQVGQQSQDLWYLNAVDAYTGNIVWRQLYASGTTGNTNYSAISIAPDGTIYIGALIGLVRLVDHRAPAPATLRPSLRLTKHLRVVGADAVYVARIRVGTKRHGARCRGVARVEMIDGQTVRLRRAVPLATCRGGRR